LLLDEGGKGNVMKANNKCVNRNEEEEEEKERTKIIINRKYKSELSEEK